VKWTVNHVAKISNIYKKKVKIILIN